MRYNVQVSDCIVSGMLASVPDMHTVPSCRTSMHANTVAILTEWLIKLAVNSCEECRACRWLQSSCEQLACAPHAFYHAFQALNFFVLQKQLVVVHVKHHCRQEAPQQGIGRSSS